MTLFKWLDINISLIHLLYIMKMSNKWNKIRSSQFGGFGELSTLVKGSLTINIEYYIYPINDNSKY
jgi:hypothetical protein